MSMVCGLMSSPRRAVQAAKDGSGRRRSTIFMSLPDKQQYPGHPHASLIEMRTI
jgi:hypothetical protein